MEVHGDLEVIGVAEPAGALLDAGDFGVQSLGHGVGNVASVWLTTDAIIDSGYARRKNAGCLPVTLRWNRGRGGDSHAFLRPGYLSARNIFERCSRRRYCTTSGSSTIDSPFRSAPR